MPESEAGGSPDLVRPWEYHEDGVVTLLVNFYSSHGIVFAADSAATITMDKRRGPERLPKQKKLQRTSRLGISGGVVGYFGLAQVGMTEPMDHWLRRSLDSWSGSAVAADLGSYLRDALNREVPYGHRRRIPSGLHIGTFEDRGGVAVPVMQYVSNIYGREPRTGNYCDFRAYSSEEHFPDNPNPLQSMKAFSNRQIRTKLRQHENSYGLPYWFRNGQLEFSAKAWDGVPDAIRDITRDLGKSGFRLPDDLSKWEKIAKAILRTTGVLDEVLVSHGAPTIEGPYRTVSIPWP